MGVGGLMKKLLTLIISFAAVLTLGATLSVESMPEFDVDFVGLFDNANIPDSEATFAGRAYGSRIELDGSVAGVAGYTFEFWVVNGVVRKDLAVDHSFVVTGPMTISAVFSQAGEHAVLFMDANGKLLDTQYVSNTENASEPSVPLPDKPGYTPLEGGSRWSGSLTNITESQVLILQYGIDESTEFTITVQGGIIDGTVDSEADVLYNSIIAVTPNPPEPLSGDVFSHWEIDGKIVSYQETYKFTALENMTVEAVFAAEAATPEPLINLYGDLELRLEHKTFRAQFEIPEGYELIDYGMLVSTDAETLDLSSATEKFTGTKWVGRQL